ncbi:MAG: tail-specific protease, partial [Alteromonadaceae bacterium]
GPETSTLRIKLLSNGQHKSVAVVRGHVKLSSQRARLATYPLEVSGNNYLIGVVSVPAFYTDSQAAARGDKNYLNVAKDVKAHLVKLETMGVDGIVIDLRNNDGGSLSLASKLTDLFIHHGPIIQIRGSDGRISRHNRSRNDASYHGPLAVLINRHSAGSSEIFAAAIQDYQRGLILGSASYGLGTVQTYQPIGKRGKGGSVKLTVGTYYRVNGEGIQLRGVTPDIAFPNIDDHTVGESSYSNALPWDKRLSVPLKVYPRDKQHIGAVKKLHEQRAEQSPTFSLATQLAQSLKQRNDAITVTLNKNTRKQWLDASDTLDKALKQLAPNNQDIFLDEAMRILLDDIVTK